MRRRKRKPCQNNLHCIKDLVLVITTVPMIMPCCSCPSISVCRLYCFPYLSVISEVINLANLPSSRHNHQKPYNQQLPNPVTSVFAQPELILFTFLPEPCIAQTADLKRINMEMMGVLYITDLLIG